MTIVFDLHDTAVIRMGKLLRIMWSHPVDRQWRTSDLFPYFETGSNNYRRSATKSLLCKLVSDKYVIKVADGVYALNVDRPINIATIEGELAAQDLLLRARRNHINVATADGVSE